MCEEKTPPPIINKICVERRPPPPPKKKKKKILSSMGIEPMAESNNCFIIHCFEENNNKLTIARSLN